MSTKDLFDAHFATWRAGLSAEELTALRYYQGLGHERINRVLRDLLDPADLPPGLVDYLAFAIDAIDAAISRGSVPVAVTVYRGVRSCSDSFGSTDASALVGREITDPAFLSTTLEIDVAAKTFAHGGDPAVVELSVPAGHPAAWMPLAGFTYAAGEQEVLLPRETPFRVLSIDQSSTPLIIRGEVIA